MYRADSVDSARGRTDEFGYSESHMANCLYVDNSNVWIEGMHVAGVINGRTPLRER